MEEILKAFELPLVQTDVVEGPNTKKIYLKPTKPFKLNKILSLEKELGMYFKVGDKLSIQIEGEYITLEMPNTRKFPKKPIKKADPVTLEVSIGESYGEEIKIKLAEMPHMIIAGTTGSGKSVTLRRIISQLEHYDFIDGKTVDLKEAAARLSNFETMMDTRYLLYARLEKVLGMPSGSMDIDLWNKKATFTSSIQNKWVVIIDEYADLVMQDRALGKNKYNIESKVIRLMQKARACGIHVIVTTQRPDAKILNGLIRANAPGRIALKTANKLESRIILDKPGAEKLLGKGDMIVSYPGFERRCQGYV